MRLGHRHSEDFDFFSNLSFAPESLRKRVQYVHGGEVLQSEANTLTVIVHRDGPVKVSFWGGLNLNRVQDPDRTPDNHMQVASLLDVAATKLATIQQRAQARDYEDLRAIVGAGISLAEALGAAAAAYGKEFNGALSLKALTYFEDGDLPNLSPSTQAKLRALAGQVSLSQIPLMQARVGVTQKRGVPK